MKVSQTTLLSVLVGALSAPRSYFVAAFVPGGVHFRRCATPSAIAPVSSPVSAGFRRFSRVVIGHMSEGDEMGEEENPLEKGLESVSWLPSVFNSGPGASTSSPTPDDAEVLPLFPLGGIVYTPNSEHVLNIFEPRYRAMYNDILMNGSKKFVVTMSHPTEQGRFAQMGVIFNLDDLKEVSEQTGDQIKYICNHKVSGRVKLHKILNPEAWSTRETYLKCEGTIIDDVGEDEEGGDEEARKGISVDTYEDEIYTAIMGAASKAGTLSPEEYALQKSFSSLVDLQHQLEEDVRFTRASAGSFGVSANVNDEPNLWTSIKLWSSYAEQRLVARQNEMQQEFQSKLLEFLKKEKGLSEKDIPSAIGFEDLSPELQQEVKELQKRMAMELQPLVLEQTLTMQKILEAKDHMERVNLVRYFVDAERKRLEAKKTLKGMFTGSPGSVFTGPEAADNAPLSGKPQKEDVAAEPKADDSLPSQSLLMDEPDAFQ